MDFSNENGIVPTDFSDVLTGQALSLRSIVELFQSTRFREQFFFIDACRNIPYEGEFRISHYDKPRPPAIPVSPQFIMYATGPGLKAQEIHRASDERGAFTSALIEGLNGKGTAKAWSGNDEEYVVRWERLFSYVERELRSMNLAMGGGLIQLPRQGGEHGSENPDLGHFGPDAFSAEILEVDLDPAEAASKSEIVVGDFGGIVERSAEIQRLPVSFELMPRTYSVRAAASGYESKKRYYEVDVYGPQSSITVEFSSVRQLGTPPALAEEEVADLTRGLAGEQAPGSITIRSEDPLARVELLDSSGAIVAKSNGNLWQPVLPPGFYRARLVDPEGRYVEQRVELLPGEAETVTLGAPERPKSDTLGTIMGRAKISVEKDNLLRIPEFTQPMAFAQLSTVLAMARGSSDPDAWGDRLREIGVRSFRQLVGESVSSGVHILFGIDADEVGEASDYLSTIKLQCWSHSQDVPQEYQTPSTLPGYPGLAEFAWDRQADCYWVSIEAQGQPAIAFSVAVLPERTTLLVFDRASAQEVSIYQYMPSAAPEGHEYSDPVLRRSELLQRSYRAGRLDESDANAEQLLYFKWREPIAGCLGGYMLLKTNPQNHLLSVGVNNLITYFPGLSDSHVLHAAYLEYGNDTEAVSAYCRALDRGIPVLRDSLIRLAYGIERNKIEHARSNLVRHAFEKHVPGLLWTALPVAELGPLGQGMGR